LDLPEERAVPEQRDYRAALLPNPFPTPGFRFVLGAYDGANRAWVRAAADAGRRELVPLRWGLIPSWVKDKIGVKYTIARAETIATAGPFRAAFRRGRCLVLADGYYEFTGQRGDKRPWHHRFHNDAAFAFASLWECWKPPEGEPVETCAIVTTAANKLAARYHDRMPVILDPTDYARWLAPTERPEDLLPLLESRPVSGLEVAAANLLVNNWRNDGPELLVPAA
jgi:putative SOS response-associated peptidase YedK